MPSILRSRRHFSVGRVKNEAEMHQEKKKGSNIVLKTSKCVVPSRF